MVAGVLLMLAIQGALLLRGPNPMEGYSAGLAFENHAAEPPARELRITRFREQVEEIWVELVPSVSLASVIELQVFDGFTAEMSPEEAKARVGAPTGQWLDPEYRVVATYYDRPGGRVSLCPVPGSSSGVSWTTVGYPKGGAQADLIRDHALRRQLQPFVPAYGAVTVQLRAQDGRLTLIIRGTGEIILVARSQGAANGSLQPTALGAIMTHSG